MMAERAERLGIVLRWAVVFSIVVGGTAVSASEVEIFRLQSQKAFLRGTLEGMSVDEIGTLRLAPKAERITSLSEPFLLSAAVHPEGWVVGTGNDGRVFLVRPGGTVEKLFEADEPEIFAVWVDEAGTIYAGSSPGGHVYRYRDGKAEVFFSPGELYVWDLKGVGGDLLVATGTQGKLFRVDGDGEGEVVWDSDDTHVRSVAVDGSGGILAGTAGEGLIVRIDETGTVATLHDAMAPEVVDLVPGRNGEVWAAVVASEASKLPVSSRRQEGDQEEGDEDEDGEEPDVKVDATPPARLVGSRPSGFEGPRSRILRIAPSGRVETVARLKEDTVFTILWHPGGLWIGTGLEGKLYRLSDDELVLQSDVDERQIVALVPDEPHPGFATTNAAAFYRLTREPEPRGTYTSPVLDAEELARFGTFHWMGERIEGTQMRFSFRSGMSSEPDATWSPWTEARSGRDLGLGDLPPARFVQWRLEARSRGEQTPTLAGIELSYRQENLPPEIESLDVLEPGKILVPLNFNPAQQVYEPMHPDREGIFTTLGAASAASGKRTKPLWKKGYRTIRWSAEDPNDDSLVYGLEFRPEDAPGSWFPMVEGLEETHFSFDATVLPDGAYRFRLTAGDRERGPERLTDHRVSEPVIVDHTPPAVEKSRRREDRWRIEVVDELNPIREAEFSVDAGEWKSIETEDGLLDARREVLVLEVPERGEIVMLRLMDAALNSITLHLAD